MTRAEVQAGFNRLWPWVTRFTVGAHFYGGHYDATRDPRLMEFVRAFPGSKRVLELGSMEGGHTLGLASAPGVESVVGLEGRAENLERCRFVAAALEEKRVAFHHCDLEGVNLQAYGRFDACFCCGLLYHLRRPWELLAAVAAVSPQLYLWTHICSGEPTTTQGGYAGQWHAEGGLADTLSGLSEQSFWPTRSELLRMLAATGWQAEVSGEDPTNPGGHAMTIVARRGTP